MHESNLPRSSGCFTPSNSSTTDANFMLVHINPTYVTAVTSSLPAPVTSCDEVSTHDRQPLARPIRRTVIHRRHSEVPYRIPQLPGSSRRHGFCRWSTSDMLISDCVSTQLKSLDIANSSSPSASSTADGSVSEDRGKSRAGDFLSRSQSLTDLELRGLQCDRAADIIQESRTQQTVSVVTEKLLQLHVSE